MVTLTKDHHIFAQPESLMLSGTLISSHNHVFNINNLLVI